MPSYTRVWVLESLCYEFGLQAFQAIERAEGVKSRQRFLVCGCHRLQGLESGGVVTQNKLLLCHVPLPAITALQTRNPLGGCPVCQLMRGRHRSLVVLAGDAVNASPLRPRSQVQSLLPGFRDPLGMFNDQPIHIGHPKCAVGTGANHRGAEPAVGRGQEFGILFAG